MFRLKTILLLLSASLLAAVCKKKEAGPEALPFASVPVATPIVPGLADEVSGMADSKANPGALWIEEDSGNPPRVILLQHNGALQKKIYIKGATNRDWEDMALAAGPDATKSYLYIADVGDNSARYSNYSIYRFPEPLATTDTVYAPDKINFTYPDGAHDAEAILVDSRTKDIYIITKRDAASQVFKLAYPQSTTTATEAQLVVTLPFTGAVGAAISPDGKEIMIKTYPGIFYWKKAATETIETALQKKGVALPYMPEPQGEALCFKNDGSGFLTLSEKSFAASVGLQFYKRL